MRIVHLKGALRARGSAAQVLGEFRHGVLAADFHQHFVHVNRICILRGLTILGPAIQRGLRKVAIRQRTSFDRGERRMLLAYVIECLLDFFVVDCDLRFIGAQLLVAFNRNLRHHFEAGLEAQGFAVVNV